MSEQTSSPQAPRLLTRHEVAKRFNVAATTIWRWEAEGKIPRGVRVTRSTIRWREDDIDRYVLSLKSVAKSPNA